MKKLLTLLTLLTIALSTFAQEFTVGNLTYSVLSEEEKTAKVVNGHNATGTVVVPETVTYNDIEYSVTTLHMHAFYSNTNITSIELPYITSIGEYTFSGCSSLTSVIIPAVNFIGFNAFYGCSSIKSMRIGSVEQWCNITFDREYSYSCIPSTYATSPVDVYIGNSDVPVKELVIPSSVTKLPYGIFTNTTITSLSAPTVASIGNEAFYKCSSLTSVNLPSATSIGSSALSNCSSLASVNLPSATSIGSYAFCNCSSLASVNLPSVASISSEAFSGCLNVSSLYIGSAEQWCKVNFGGNNASPLQCTSQQVDLYIGSSESPATIVELPNTVTEIPNYAFSNTTITSFSAPFATSIGSDAFAGCESLEEAILPKVETIGVNAFGVYGYDDNGWQYHYCTSLRYIDLSSVTSIGYNAFGNGVNGCSNIKSLRIGSVEQWCNVSFENAKSNPLDYYRKSVDLYIGESQERATEIEIPSTITEIGREAFCNTTITSVHASNVISVGVNAFYGCELLTTVDLPMATTIESNAFKECSSLNAVNLPSALTIGDWAFDRCKSLTSISPPQATSIKDYAFWLSSIQTIFIPKVIEIGKEAFNNCGIVHLELPEVIEIANSAFHGCSSLNYLSIPKVKKIGIDAFSGIKTLHISSIEQYCNIEYTDSPYKGGYPFYGYSDGQHDIIIGDSETPATEITIPASVHQIPEYAFRGTNIHTIHFEGLTPPTLSSTNSFSNWTMLSVLDEAYNTYLNTDGYSTIPLQITTEGCISKDVEMEADDNTSKLLAKLGSDDVARKVVNLTIKGTINSYDMMIIRNRMTSLRNLDLTEAAIIDCAYEYSSGHHSVKDVITADWLSGLMNVKLPSSATSIDNNAFYECNKLVSIVIPEGVTSIGSWAFYKCGRIKDLSLPQSVTSFGSMAFAGCPGLKEIVIPDGVTSITSDAFHDSYLSKVTIPASITEIGRNAFYSSSKLSLRIMDIDKWLDVQINGYDSYGAFTNVTELYIGESDEPVETIVIPSGTTTLKDYIFAGFRCLKNVVFPQELESIGKGTFLHSGLTEIDLPEKLNSIGEYAFSYCYLRNINFADGLKKIEANAFSYCYPLSKIELPPYLETIGRYAFQGCSSITEVLIPASIKEIGNYAFEECNNLNKVIATTVEPIRINQNTFSTYRTADVYSPKTSYWKYYWNTQWNQFLSVKEYDKEFAEVYGYKYFYLNGKNGDSFEDFVIDDETGPLHGVLDPGFTISPREEFPDADFNEGAGMIVRGEQIQNLGDIHIHHNGNNGASVITKQSGKVHIDNLYVDIKVQKNRWYFFCFPFNINPGQATFDGSHVWYLYDGEARALNGNGGWKKVATDGVMQAGNGYIFQGAVNGTLTIHVTDITIDGSDNSTNMITYQSENKNDASWNLVGNSNFAYYGISDLMLEDIPLTVYNNETGNYEAVRASDGDDYELYPFQAFFVQKPESADNIVFDNTKKETKNMADQSSAAKAATKAKSKAKGNSPRKVINLELASVDTDEKATDRTRIVVNPMKTTGYETDCDAAKFIADNLPQIYSKGNDGCMYSINERPVENGIIDLVVKITKEGVYSISAPRLDCAAKLRDIETGTEVDLAEGAYTFMAEASTYTDRFKLILANGTTGITTPEEAQAAISVEAGTINITETDADVKVYSVGGSLVKAQKGAGTINVPAGTYVVNVNGQSVKVNVNE